MPTLTARVSTQLCILLVGLAVLSTARTASAGDQPRPDAGEALAGPSFSGPSAVPDLPAGWTRHVTAGVLSPRSAVQGIRAHPVDTLDTTAAPRPAGAGGLLTALYIGFAATQALDAHSTLLAVRRGAHESNPLVQPFADKPLAVLGVKAGLTVGVVYMAERVRRHSRVGAIVTMVALNSTAATLAARNYRIAAALGR